MSWAAMLLALAGLLLSALFSGAEMGFYRAARLRLTLDAHGGDRIAGGLVWLLHHPSWFVTTTLVGTNIANYFVSLAVVILADHWTGTGWSSLALAANVLVVPLLFVYGESLPKSLFLRAPNRLLKATGPVLLACVVLFAPLSALFALLNRVLLLGRARPQEPLPATLARRELQRVLEEGHQVGILHPAQRALARGIFTCAGRPIGEFLLPPGAMPEISPQTSRRDARAVAARRRTTDLCVVDSAGKRLGYAHVVDLAVGEQDRAPPVRPLPSLPATMSHLAALIRLQTSKDTLAEVVDATGRALGLVSLERLREPLLEVGVEPREPAGDAMVAT